jgi:hypothetical protein
MGGVVIVVILFFAALFIVGLVGSPVLLFFAIRSFLRGRKLRGAILTILACFFLVTPFACAAHFKHTNDVLLQRIQDERDKSKWPYQGHPK